MIVLSAPDDKVGNESCQVRRGRFASQRTLRRGTHGTRPLTRGRLAVPSRGCGAFPSVWCELTCGRPGAEPASPAGRRAPPCGPGARAWSGSGLVARRSSRGGWERWLRAAAAARPPAPAVGRRKRGTPPPHRINMHPGAGDQPSLAAPVRRVPALSRRARGERCAPGPAVPRTLPLRHLRPGGIGGIRGGSGRSPLGSSLESFPSPRWDPVPATGTPLSSFLRGSRDRRTAAATEGQTAGSGKVTPGCSGGWGVRSRRRSLEPGPPPPPRSPRAGRLLPAARSPLLSRAEGLWTGLP